MIQGTMSGVGKSLICAGLCRIFHQDGYWTAPFKSQNMALNSYITMEGLEMGRAQVVQAEAAGVQPSVRMNPILLKPTSDVGSQVIVNGEVLGTMSAREYFAYKKQLVPEIKRAFQKLDEEYDIVVIEGAGSPAEINLKSDDIVNMGMAEMADAPVLLVGDIDRGGVFAQLLGTLLLLEEKEKDRVKGLIINKFRGDKTILDPGLEMLERRGNVPVVGVAPYLHVEIEEEDSLAERLEYVKGEERAGIEIAVIRLPRISNFTDFMLLENQSQIHLRYVQTCAQLGHPDLVVLPGTKNTIGDLLWMRQNGLEAAVQKLAARGIPVFGICGGYQMLGEFLYDPERVEEGGSIRGMGLLPVETRFSPEKTRTRVQGRIGKIDGVFSGLQGAAIDGYEIHMGRTGGTGEAGRQQAIALIQDSLTGKRSEDGCVKENIYGSYIHGFFDSEEVVSGIIKALGKKKGMTQPAISMKAFRESQYDLLAKSLREHLDMKKIYQVMGIEG